MKKKAQKKDFSVMVRFAQSWEEPLKKYADELGVPLSTLIRMLALKSLKEEKNG